MFWGSMTPKKTKKPCFRHLLRGGVIEPQIMIFVFASLCFSVFRHFFLGGVSGAREARSRTSGLLITIAPITFGPNHHSS